MEGDGQRHPFGQIGELRMREEEWCDLSVS
jgi:hypothetical protein